MSRVGYLLRRFAWTVFSLCLVLTATFVLIAAPPDPNAALVAWAAARGGGNASAAMAEFQAAKGLDASLLQRYVSFMTGLVTFQWGTSFHWERPVVDLVADRTVVTLAYVVPAVLFSTVLGTVAGLYASVRKSSALDRLLSGIAYAGFGIPNFWLALVLMALFAGSVGIEAGYDTRQDVTSAHNLLSLLFPAVALGTTLFTSQLRHVRSETTTYLRSDFVKTARAKGVGTLRIARHALRNAALTLVSLVFADLLGALFVSVFVLEVALGVPGIGALAFDAIEFRDVPVVMIAMLIPVVVALVGNFVQDALTVVLDPRVEEGE